jgi:hypothetical protein
MCKVSRQCKKSRTLISRLWRTPFFLDEGMGGRGKGAEDIDDGRNAPRLPGAFRTPASEGS